LKLKKTGYDEPAVVKIEQNVMQIFEFQTLIYRRRFYKSTPSV